MFPRCFANATAVVAAALLAGCGSWGNKTSQIPSVANAQSAFAGVSSSIQALKFRVPDRIIVIVMENHSFDDIVGATNRSGYRLLTPFLTQAALNNSLATLAFGVSHPSLPNYLSEIAGDSFGIHDDNGSCYARPEPRGCHSFNKKNLVDSLEAAGISWASYNESMLRDGFLGQVWPPKGDGLYRQKHNPFAYFKDIATDPKRLAHIKTFVDLKKTLNNKLLPRFSFIVPNECHDMHGSVPFCPGPNFALIQAGDAAVQKIVNEIIGSGSFTARSLMFILWDEGGNSNLGCCDSPPFLGGGHIPLILIAGVPSAKVSAQPYNHYSVLSTIETLWNLPKLGYTADTVNVKPMLDLLPSK
jgi:phospholipase C